MFLIECELEGGADGMLDRVWLLFHEPMFVSLIVSSALKNVPTGSKVGLWAVVMFAEYIDCFPGI